MVNGVEKLEFIDFTVDLTVPVFVRAVDPFLVENFLKAYLALFDRVPDAAEVIPLLGRLMTAQANATGEFGFEAICTALLGSADIDSNVTTVTQMSNIQFINATYANLMGAVPVAGEVAALERELASGDLSRSELTADLLALVHSFEYDPHESAAQNRSDAYYDFLPRLLDNKVAVAHTLAINLGLTYDQTSHFPWNEKVIDAVTPNSTEAALSLLGVSVTQYDLV